MNSSGRRLPQYRPLAWRAARRWWVSIRAGYGPPPSRGTNTMAILALVFAFVFAPLGIIFGIVSRGQIKQTGEDGDGLALAGLIIGIVFSAIILHYIIFFFIVVGTAVNTINDFDFSDFPTPT